MIVDIDPKLPLYWHPAYRVISHPHGVLLLRQAHHPLSMPKEPFQLVAEGVLAGDPFEVMHGRAGNVVQMAQFYQLCRQMVSQGMLHQAADLRAFFQLSGREEVTSLADRRWVLGSHEQLVHQGRSVTSLTEGNVLVTADLLHPALARWQKTEPSQGLLLVQPHQENTWLAVFLSNEKGTPCLRCLQDHIGRNQPGRRWAAQFHQNEYIGLPIAMPQFILPEAQLAQVLASPNVLFEIDAEGNQQGHVVHQRPQCTDCGDPGWMQTQAQQAIRLAELTEAGGADVDGGTRVQSAQMTVAELMRFVSSLVGTITDLSPLVAAGSSSAVPIYQSGFRAMPSPNRPLRPGNLIQRSLGKGMSDAQSQASALSESIERFAAQWQGDEWVVQLAAKHLEGKWISPHEFRRYSQIQYQEFDAVLGQVPQAVRPYAEDIPLQWTMAWAVSTGKGVWVPAEMCYSNTPGTDYEYIKWDSNGAAAGVTREEAMLQGLLELVERDATAIWWYNRIPRPSVPLDTLASEDLGRIEASLADKWSYWVLDITHDLGIPVRVAVAQNKEDHTFLLGFGCHPNRTLATLRALTELCQLVPIRAQAKAAFDFSAITPAPYLFPTGTVGVGLPSSGSVTDRLSYCVGQVERQGLSVLTHDYSRPDLPLKTVKMLVPGLAHTWPQLGNDRLFDVPVRMKWRSEPLREKELHPVHLLI